MKIKHHRLSCFAIVLNLLACQGPAGFDGRNGQDGVDGQDGKDACTGPDPIYWRILRDFQAAEIFRSSCAAYAEADYATCLALHDDEEFPPCKQAGNCISFCTNLKKAAFKHCHKLTAQKANVTVNHLCGAQVLNFNEDEPELAYQLLGSEDDTDGDGISNYSEYLRLSNPCSDHSYGSCLPDSELPLIASYPQYLSDLLASDAPSAVTVTSERSATLEPRSCGYSAYTENASY